MFQIYAHSMMVATRLAPVGMQHDENRQRRFHDTWIRLPQTHWLDWLRAKIRRL